MAIANGKKASANGATTKKKATGGRIAGLVAGEPERVSIPPTKIGKFALRLIGQSPLICHAWDAKSIKMIEDSEGGKPKEKKAPKDPWAEFCGSLYWLTERPEKPTEKDIAKAKFGMPGNSFKLSAVNACRYVDGISMTFAYGAFHVIGQFVEIEGPPPRMRQDTVRVGKFGSKSATMRYRGALGATGGATGAAGFACDGCLRPFAYGHGVPRITARHATRPHTRQPLVAFGYHAPPSS